MRYNPIQSTRDVTIKNMVVLLDIRSQKREKHHTIFVAVAAAGRWKEAFPSVWDKTGKNSAFFFLLLAPSVVAKNTLRLSSLCLLGRTRRQGIESWRRRQRRRWLLTRIRTHEKERRRGNCCRENLQEMIELYRKTHTCQQRKKEW